MRRRWVVAGLVCALAAPAPATEIVAEHIGATSQGFLFVDSRVEQPFEGRVLEGIRSGLPSTLTFTIEVWQQRAGWWDRLEEAREFRFRVLRDLLAEQYILASPEDVRRFPSLDSLAAVACKRRDYLRPSSERRPYYVVLGFNLAPLSVEDLRELEDWLQGTPGVTEVSGTVVGMLMSATGFGDQTVSTRTRTFVPQDVRREGPEP